jgi:hypothetical protein
MRKEHLAPKGKLFPTKEVGRLDPTKLASLSLKLQVDETGNLTWVGIDLKKLGLSSIANEITVVNNIPSLQAKGQLKSTISSQVDLSVPQAIGDVTTSGDVSTQSGAKKNIERDAKGNITVTAVADPPPPPPAVAPAPAAAPQTKKKPIKINGLNHIANECEDSFFLPNRGRGLFTPLFLKKWMDRFFRNFDEDKKRRNEEAQRDGISITPVACMSKLTLQTQFMVGVDVSAGTGPIIGSAFIIPISSLNIEYDPQFTHSLTMALSLNPNDGRINPLEKDGIQALEQCTQPSTQPNTTVQTAGRP